MPVGIPPPLAWALIYANNLEGDRFFTIAIKKKVKRRTCASAVDKRPAEALQALFFDSLLACFGSCGMNSARPVPPSWTRAGCRKRGR